MKLSEDDGSIYLSEEVWGRNIFEQYNFKHAKFDMTETSRTRYQ